GSDRRPALRRDAAQDAERQDHAPGAEGGDPRPRPGRHLDHRGRGLRRRGPGGVGGDPQGSARPVGAGSENEEGRQLTAVTAPAPRNSLGIWAFGPNVTRFVPAGYHPEAASESMLEKTRRVADGLSDVLDGLEYHYPGEVDEDSAPALLDVLRGCGMDLPIVASGLHVDPTYALGSL